MYPKERTAVSSVTPKKLKEAQWLLTRDALTRYASPNRIVNFNYAKFGGGFKKMEGASPALSYLKIESDNAEERSVAFGQPTTTLDIIKEGFLVVVPGDSSFVDNFRSEKKRYCVVRRDDEGRVHIEIQKPATKGNAANVAQLPLEIKHAMLKTTKKGKTVLQVRMNVEF